MLIENLLNAYFRHVTFPGEAKAKIFTFVFFKIFASREKVSK